MTFTNGYNLIVTHECFGLPVAIPVMIEVIMRFFQMMDFVFVDGFELFAFLAVLVVCIFNHLVSSFIHASVYLVAIVVVFYFDRLEHSSVGLVFDYFEHLAVLVVLVFRVQGVVAHGLRDTGDVSDAVGVVCESDGDAVTVEYLFAAQELVAVVQVLATGYHQTSGIIFFPAGGQCLVIVMVVSFQKGVFVVAELDVLQKKPVGGVLLYGGDVRFPAFQNLADVGGVIHHDGIFCQKVGFGVDMFNIPIDMVALQMGLFNIRGDDDRVGFLFAPGANGHQQGYQYEKSDVSHDVTY